MVTETDNTQLEIRLAVSLSKLLISGNAVNMIGIIMAGKCSSFLDRVIF